jgi:hypothetical protein
MADHVPTSAANPSLSARALTAALGVWLFISAFVYPHTIAQRANTWICGVLAFVFALAATRTPQARVLNSILAIWLFVSVWILPRASAAMGWNNVIVAIAIFCLSLVPSTEVRSPGGRISQGV